MYIGGTQEGIAHSGIYRSCGGRSSESLMPKGGDQRRPSSKTPIIHDCGGQIPQSKRIAPAHRPVASLHRPISDIYASGLIVPVSALFAALFG